MSGLLRADELHIARQLTNAERERRRYHLCDSCKESHYPCYRIRGAVLCPNCARAALGPTERVIV